MLFENTETLKAIAAIEAGARGWTKNELAAVLKLARARKPPEFDATSIGAQKRYRGRQKELVTKAIKDAFPSTEGMTASPVNWLKLIARLDAGVYVVPPDRFLEDEKKNRIPNDDARAQLWQWALEKSCFHIKMAECERRALIPPGVAVGHVVWMKPPGDPVGYPKINLYWGHDVEVLCHWSAPTSWEMKYVVALRQASPDPSSPGEWYRVFSRKPPAAASGEWGPWTSVLVSTEGEQAAETATPEEVPGNMLPIFLVQLSDPEGSPFVLEDPDLLDVVDDLNVRRANESFVINMQGHDQMWSDDIKEGGYAKAGPDVIHQVMKGSQVGILSPNPKLSDMRESRDQALRELATSRGNSPHAYVTKASGNPPTGVAMRYEDRTHDTRVAEQATLMQSVEEAGPLRILLDVVIAYHPNREIAARLKGLRPRMVPRKQPMFEDPTQKQTRLAIAVDRKWITNERAAADMELYPDVETAKKAIDDILGAEDGGADEVTTDAAATATATVDPTVPVAGADTVQDTALNGAQVEAFNGIVDKVVTKQWPKEAARAAIIALFPAMDPKQVDAVLDPLSSFEPAPSDAPAPGNEDRTPAVQSTE